MKRIIKKATALFISLLLVFSCSALLGASASTDIFDISGGVLNRCNTGAAGVIDNIPSTVTKIKTGAFKGCNAITEVVIPASVTEIGSNAFDSCTSLKSVTISGADCEIGAAAFIHCSALQTITLPSNLSEIADETFYDCTSLSSIEIPSGVTLIGREAFNMCRSLTVIEIPASVKTIRANAFLGCSGVKEFVVDSNNTVYSSKNGVLYGPLESPYDPEISATVTDKALINYPAGATATSFSIPSGVLRIADDAFNSNEIIKSVTLPGSIKTIGSHAFFSCTALETINIPSSVTEVGPRAFDGCTALKSITIPASVTSFENAFCYSGLTSVVFEDGVKTVSTGAFNNCRSLETVTIPASVTSIENGAFSACPDTMTFICEEGSYAHTYALSNDINVKVNTVSGDKTVKSIAISAYPDKTDYIYKEVINTNGLELTVTYADGTTETVTKGYTISPSSIQKVGDQQIKVTYGDASAYFEVSASYAWWQWIIMIILLGFLWY